MFYKPNSTKEKRLSFEITNRVPGPGLHSRNSNFHYNKVTCTDLHVAIKMMLFDTSDMMLSAFHSLLLLALLNTSFVLVYACSVVSSSVRSLKSRPNGETWIINFCSQAFEVLHGVIEKVQKRKSFLCISVLAKCMLDLTAYMLFYGMEATINELSQADLATICLFLTPINFIVATSIAQPKGNLNYDIALSFACSYFYGYLKKVSPFFDDCIKASAVPNNNKTIIVPKRLVLIPKNGWIYDNLSEVDSRINFCVNAVPILLNNAGTRQRSYIHSLYKLSSGGTETEKREFICSLEYATPLRALSDMKKAFPLEQSDIQEISKIFFEILSEKVADAPDLGSCVQLIWFSGEKEEIVDIVLQCIREDEIVETRKSAKYEKL